MICQLNFVANGTTDLNLGWHVTELGISLVPNVHQWKPEQ